MRLYVVLNGWRTWEGTPFMFYVRARSPEQAREVARRMFLRLDEVLNRRMPWSPKGEAFVEQLDVLEAEEGEALGERSGVVR